MCLERLEQALKNWQAKLAEFEYELSITSNAEQKFELKRKIKECEGEIERLKTSIDSITLQIKPHSIEEESAKSHIHINNQSPPIENKPDMYSEQGIDYTLLSYLLEQQQWQKADLETNRIMLQAAIQEEQRWLKAEDIKKFPCQDLLTIDRLWWHYSKGRFGFSVQTRIWLEEKSWRFAERIGWLREDPCVFITEKLNFSLYAPLGHLPSWNVAARFGRDTFVKHGGYNNILSSLSQRLAECSIDKTSGSSDVQDTEESLSSGNYSGRFGTDIKLFRGNLKIHKFIVWIFLAFGGIGIIVRFFN